MVVWRKVGLTILFVGSFLFVAGCGTPSVAGTTSTSGENWPGQECYRKEVLVARGLSPLIPRANITPDGMPHVAARVNDLDITSMELMNEAILTQNDNRAQLEQLPKSAPASERKALNVSHGQLLKQVLTSLIQKRLWYSEARQQGKVTPSVDVNVYLRNMVTYVHKQKQGSPMETQFAGYLCANHLNDVQFQSDPDVFSVYQMSLTIQSAQNAYLRKQSAQVQNIRSLSESAIASHIEDLQKRSKIETFVPPKMLS